MPKVSCSETQHFLPVKFRLQADHNEYIRYVATNIKCSVRVADVLWWLMFHACACIMAEYQWIPFPQYQVIVSQSRASLQTSSFLLLILLSPVLSIFLSLCQMFPTEVSKGGFQGFQEPWNPPCIQCLDILAILAIP